MVIDDYRFGQVTVDGVTHTSDLIIHAGRLSGWRRISGHLVERDDIEKLVAEQPAVIVIGTGASGMMKLPMETREFLESTGIRVIDEPTAKAVNSYNKLVAQGVDVAIAMHLTC